MNRSDTQGEVERSFTFCDSELTEMIVSETLEAEQDRRGVDPAAVYYRLCLTLVTVLMDHGWNKDEILRDMAREADAYLLHDIKSDCVGSA